MDPIPARHRLALLAAGLLLALTAGYGVLSGLTESGGETLGQRIAGWAELGYGALAVGGIAALLWRRALVRPLLYAWGVLLIITIPLGSVVWGGAGIGPAAVLALAAAAVAGLVLWLVRRGLAG